MPRHCLMFRYEADGFEDGFDWVAADHKRDYWRSGDMCLLEEGHKGPHDFVPQDEIGVSFADVEAH